VYRTTSDKKLMQYAGQFRELGLEEGEHFTVKQPSGGEPGYLCITAECVIKLAELRKRAKDPNVRLKADEWIKYLLARAEESGGKKTREAGGVD